MKPNYLLPYLCVFFFLTNSSVFSSWKPVALNGTNVTALFCKTGPLFVGTEKSGVYCVDNHTTSQIGTDSLKGSTVQCLEVFGQGDIVFAGTDKGLFSYSKKSGSGWTKNEQVGDSSVQALMRYQDTLLFVITNKAVYRSTFKTGSVAENLKFEVINVSEALPPGSKNLELRCITKFRDTLFLGSILTESNSSWGGILRSFDKGNTWSVFNGGWTGMAQPGIKSLVVFLEQFNSIQPTYLANAIIGTNKGESAIFRKKGSDATWERVADLNNCQSNRVYVSFFSNSMVALEHIASDSGVYINKNGHWERIGTIKGVNVVIGNDDGSTGMGYTVLFAGTTTGLFENLTTTLIKKNLTNATKPVKITPVHSLLIQNTKKEGKAAGCRIILDHNSKSPISLQGKSVH